jgi:hypothetical protein
MVGRPNRYYGGASTKSSTLQSLLIIGIATERFRLNELAAA